MSYNKRGIYVLLFPSQILCLFSVSQVRESVINPFLVAKHHFILSDVVSEDEVPSIG